MARFFTRTRRFMAGLWLGTIALEAGVLVLADRTDNSWVLLLGLGLLAIPLAAMDMTWRWFARPARKRWKRHDLEDALAAEAAAQKLNPSAAVAAPARPQAQ
jgi:hypothetical protein